MVLLVMRLMVIVMTVVVLILMIMLASVGGRIVCATTGAVKPFGAAPWLAHEVVFVMLCPYQGVVLPHSNLVRGHQAGRHAVVVAVHELHYFAHRPFFWASLALDNVPDRKAQRVALELQGFGCGQAVVEPCSKLCVVEPLADEDELALARLAFLPRLCEGAIHHHVHRVEYEALLGMGNGQDAFHPENVLASRLEQLGHPRLDEVEVELALAHLAHVTRAALVEADARDGLVVLGGRGRWVQEGWIVLKSSLQVKAVQVEHAIDRHRGVLAAQDGCETVDLTKALFDALDGAGGDQVGLVKQQPIRKSDLCRRLVDHAFWLLLVEVALDVLSVDECDHAVETCKRADLRIDEKSLRHGPWVSHASCLDHNRIEVNLAEPLTCCELLQHSDQIGPH
mmetsp:Transcript_33705/g.67129  ORF Transcript_33705/g.67129 Transcript_33705/m.67129 type:complete len:396 (+) Transcript_33705:309-1496(+)